MPHQELDDVIESNAILVESVTVFQLLPTIEESLLIGSGIEVARQLVSELFDCCQFAQVVHTDTFAFVLESTCLSIGEIGRAHV